MNPVLTLFSVPKAFESNIDVIQRNALGSWKALGDRAEVLLIGDDPGVSGAAAEFGFGHVPEVKRNRVGTPRVDSTFALARRYANSPVLCYINADIILVEGLLQTARLAANRFPRFLVVGQRWDLTIDQRLEFGPGWRSALAEAIQQRGRLHPPAGSDYFVFPKTLFGEMPSFALGRSGWDNWMIYAGRRKGVPVIDATGSVTIVHQDHDYSHLEHGQPHYRLPESQENVRLAGGPHAIFTLRDTTWRIKNGALARVGLPGGSLGRAAESELIARIPPGLGHRILRVVLHPVEFLQSRARRLLGQFDGAQEPEVVEDG